MNEMLYFIAIVIFLFIILGVLTSFIIYQSLLQYKNSLRKVNHRLKYQSGMTDLRAKNTIIKHMFVLKRNLKLFKLGIQLSTITLLCLIIVVIQNDISFDKQRYMIISLAVINILYYAFSITSAISTCNKLTELK